MARTRSIRWQVTAMVLGGFLVGIVAFAATSAYPQQMYLGPLCRSEDLRPAGFDPWTGEPVGDVYRCDPTWSGDPPAHLVTLPVPEDLVGRRAISIPVGFMIGCVLLSAVLVARRFALIARD
jgi:hypothetical protein